MLGSLASALPKCQCFPGEKGKNWESCRNTHRHPGTCIFYPFNLHGYNILGYTTAKGTATALRISGSPPLDSSLFYTKGEPGTETLPGFLRVQHLSVALGLLTTGEVFEGIFPLKIEIADLWNKESPLPEPSTRLDGYRSFTGKLKTNSNDSKTWPLKITAPRNANFQPFLCTGSHMRCFCAVTSYLHEILRVPWATLDLATFFRKNRWTSREGSTSDS